MDSTVVNALRQAWNDAQPLLTELSKITMNGYKDFCLERGGNIAWASSEFNLDPQTRTIFGNLVDLFAKKRKNRKLILKIWADLIAVVPDLKCIRFGLEDPDQYQKNCIVLSRRGTDEEISLNFS